MGQISKGLEYHLKEFEHGLGQQRTLGGLKTEKGQIYILIRQYIQQIKKMQGLDQRQEGHEMNT